MNNRIRFSDHKEESNPNPLTSKSEEDYCQKNTGEIISVNDKISQTKHIVNSPSKGKKNRIFLNSGLKNDPPIGNPNNLSMQPKISVIIPCLNEEAGLKIVLPKIHEVMSKTESPYEIIVVDDGSKDKTAKIAKEHYATVLINSYNQGKGAALQKGFRYAKGSIVITMDGDGSHKAEDIPRLIEPILKDRYELVIGSRFLNTSGNNATNLRQLIGNKLLNYMIWFLTGRRLTDSQSGFRVFSKNLLHKVGNLSSKGYEIESEFAVKAIKLFRDKIIEIPIKNLDRMEGVSRLVIVRDGLKILKRIIKDTFSNSRYAKD